MKKGTKNPFVVSVLIACLGLMLAGRMTAQTFTTLHSFTNSDGAHPIAELILLGNALYGTTPGGGTSNFGVVFAVNTDGRGFIRLHSFDVSGNDGFGPMSGLTASGNRLFGTRGGGLVSHWVSGTVFAINTDGSGFTNLYSFTPLSAPPWLNGTNSDGADSRASLILSGNTLYGTAQDGGGPSAGTVFAVNTDGTGFTVLHSFMDNGDGDGPNAALALSGNTLYGTTIRGGFAPPLGTVFKVSTAGTSFMTVYSFIGPGSYSRARLVLSGNTLYGTTEDGSFAGNGGNGTVFRVNTDGTGFTNLHIFAAGKTNLLSGVYTNAEGIKPFAGLLLSGNTLYGTTQFGGSPGNGTVFAVNTDGTGFTVLHSFTASNTNSSGLSTNSDGATPQAGLILEAVS